MTRLLLATGVAALAITAPAASAPQGGDHGRTHVAKAQQGGGGGETKKARGGKAKAQRAETRQQRAATRDRTTAKAPRADRQRVADTRRDRNRAEARVERRADAQRRADRRELQVQRREDAVARANARQLGRNNNPVVDARDRQLRAADRMDARDRQLQRVVERSDRQVARLDARRERQIERIDNRRDRQLARLAETRVIPAKEWSDLARGGVWLNGCPPGLAKKPVACVPPGQVKNLVGQPVSLLGDRMLLQDVPIRLRSVYADTPNYYWRYGNGYMYQVDRSDNLVRSLLPLFGLGLTVGQPFPMAYSNYYMPAGLQPFYANRQCGFDPYGSNDYYRYANGYVYEIDCMTGLIEDVDPMLGYGYGYGQMMPVTYSAYNVPYQYRPLYYDTSNYYYRYAPGAIYQVDPTTSLITAVAALLTGGLNVGQPLPVGYSAYNVPYAYRTTYYDTPNDWYRYSNGYVYRVDPSTMLVTAIVASALT